MLLFFFLCRVYFAFRIGEKSPNQILWTIRISNRIINSRHSPRLQIIEIGMGFFCAIFAQANRFTRVKSLV